MTDTIIGEETPRARLIKQLERMIGEPAWPRYYMDKDEAQVCVDALSGSPEVVTVMREALDSVRQRLMFAADYQRTTRGDYLYKGHPDQWLADSINEIDAALSKVALPL